MKEKDVRRQISVLIDTFNLLKDDAVKRSDYVEASRIRSKLNELKLQLNYPPSLGFQEIMELTECDAPGIDTDSPAGGSDNEEMAWTIIANAYGGDWSLASEEWRAAATRWRDAYHGPCSSWPAGLPIPHRDSTDLVAEALDKLSGTLSHDNVAAAKQILKKILD